VQRIGRSLCGEPLRRSGGLEPGIGEHLVEGRRQTPWNLRRSPRPACSPVYGGQRPRRQNMDSRRDRDPGRVRNTPRRELASREPALSPGPLSRASFRIQEAARPQSASPALRSIALAIVENAHVGDHRMSNRSLSCVPASTGRKPVRTFTFSWRSLGCRLARPRAEWVDRS
jgi:hypothetical protein